MIDVSGSLALLAEPARPTPGLSVAIAGGSGSPDAQEARRAAEALGALGALGDGAGGVEVVSAGELAGWTLRVSPDLIVLVGEQAVDLCRLVRRRWSAPERPVLLLGPCLADAFAAGADDAIAGRWSAEELAVRARALVRSHRLHRQALAAAAAEARAAAADAPERGRALPGLDLLARISQALMGSLDTRAIAGLTRLVVPELADLCAVYLADDAGQARLADAFSVDPDLGALAYERLLRSTLPGQPAHAVTRVVRTGRSVFLPRLLDADLCAVAADPEQLGRLRASGLHAWLCVPLTLGARTLGAIACGRTGTSRPLDAADLALVEELARLAAMALDNARLFERAEHEQGRAEEANRLKDEFLANLSHELRTPLTAILGWTRILRTRTLSDDKRARALEAVERNAAAQTRLVEDLLDLSRIIAEKLTLDRAPVDPVQVIESALDALRPAADHRGVSLRAVVEHAVGPLSGDFDRLRQVAVNLVANAVKFTPPGGSVEVRLGLSDGSARIEVADTGQGISPEFLPHVFDRFRQADGGYTRAHGGLGLGLAIVRHLVELHGGSVEAASGGEGQGATFTVRLPLG